MIKKFISWLKSVFVSEKEQTLEDKISYLSSTRRMEHASKSAYQELQRQGCFSGAAPDGNEIEIRTECMQLDLSLTDFYYKKISKQITDAKTNINKLSADVSIKLVGLSPSAAEAEIIASLAQKKLVLNSLYKHFKDTEQNLQIFKGANGINRDPEMPDSDKASIIIMGVFIVFEAIANMLFLRQGASTPTALLIAVVAAVLNISISAYLGTIYRWINHHDSLKKSKGYMAVVAAFLFVVFLNSFVAFARIKIAEEGDASIVNTTFLVESLFLYLVGLTLGSYAFIKGYKLDDPYPGYGSLHRTWLAATEDFNSEASEARQTATVIPENMDRKIQSEIDSIEYANDQATEALDRTNKDLNEWSSHREVLDNAFQGVVSAYRSVAESHLINKGRKVPSYFSTPAKLENNKLLEATKLEFSEVGKKIFECANHRKQNLEKLYNARTSLMDWRAKNLNNLISAHLPE